VRLRYTLPALADVSAILDYVAANSPQGARRVQARIQAVLDLLVEHPRIGRRANDPAIRRITTKPYPYLIFLRGRADRNYHSCGPERGPRPVPNARFCVINARVAARA